MKPIKPEMNPYEPSMQSSTDEPMKEEERDLCPACRGRLSRWKIWNSILAGRCDHCGEKVWLELGGLFRVVLPVVGFGSCGLLWLISEYWQVRFGNLFLVVPLLMTALSCWMQITYGKIVSVDAKRPV